MRDGIGRGFEGCFLVNIGDDFLGGGTGAGCGDFFGATGAEGVGDEGVGGRVDELEEFLPEGLELLGRQEAFEEGVLDADAVVFAVAGDFGKAFGAGDVVGDDGDHLVLAAGVSALFGWCGVEGEEVEPPVFGDCRHGWRGIGWNL